LRVSPKDKAPDLKGFSLALNDIKDARDNKGYLTCEEVNDLIPTASIPQMT